MCRVHEQMQEYERVLYDSEPHDIVPRQTEDESGESTYLQEADKMIRAQSQFERAIKVGVRQNY